MAIVENDSLYFQKKGSKQAVAPVKNKTNFNSLPVIAIDNSASQFKDRIYICWSDEKNGINNKDVFIVYSDDDGKNWTEPILVTYRPNHKDQFMPAISIDEKGTVYLLYYDAQNYFENGYADIYLAISNNGGLKFNYYKLNQQPIKQTLKLQTKTSLHLINESGKIFASQREEKKKANSTFIINDTLLNTINIAARPEIQFERTFTFSPKLTIDYSVNEDMKLTAVLTKPLLAGFEKIIVKNISVKKGNNRLILDMEKLGVKKGNYVLTFYYNGKNDLAWITD